MWLPALKFSSQWSVSSSKALFLVSLLSLLRWSATRVLPLSYLSLWGALLTQTRPVCKCWIIPLYRQRDLAICYCTGGPGGYHGKRKKRFQRESQIPWVVSHTWMLKEGWHDNNNGKRMLEWRKRPDLGSAGYVHTEKYRNEPLHFVSKNDFKNRVI